MDPEKLKEANQALERYQRMRKKRGRPSVYSDALGRAICKMLASGMTLIDICMRPGMPNERRVREWARNPNHPFSPLYARAREVGYDRLADQLIKIADEEVDNPGEAMRNRLRVDTRKWMLSKMLPKVYGDRTETTVKHDVGEQFIAFMRDRVSPKLAKPVELKVHKGGKYGA